MTAAAPRRRAFARVRVAVEGGDIGVLARSFGRSLEAANKSPATVYLYGASVRYFAAFLAAQGMPLVVANITREHVEEFIADVLRRRTPGTASSYHRGLRAFFNWLVDDGEIRDSPMARIKTPKVPEHAPTMLTDDELRRLLKTCEGNAFEQRRDLAFLRLLMDTGVRLGEASGLSVDDVDLDSRVVRVLGKGSRVRVIPFGRKTAAALDRYERERARHKHAETTTAYWLGRLGPFTSSGVDMMIRRRAREAGLPATHAHLFRHGFAHAWLSQGGQEQDLMMLAGWRSRTMLGRYAASAAAERARDAYRNGRSPGDRL
jgi:site-specific recombinase XerD